MEAVPQADNLMLRNLADGAADLDLLENMLMNDGWLEFPDCSDILQSGSPNAMSPFNSLSFSPLFELSSSGFAPISQEARREDYNEASPMPVSPSFARSEREFTDSLQSRSSDAFGRIICSVQSGEVHTRIPSSEQGLSWRIQSADLSSSVKERFWHAISYIRDSHKDADVLVQLWVPVKREDHLFLTTCSQPFSVSPNCEKLEKYRVVSGYYQFPAEENSANALAMPSRVFLRRVPEWTPDVQFFTSFEYVRVDHAQSFDVRGTIALPVFERNGHSCLGVVEVVMTTQKINYSYEVENICHALQAVDLRTSEALSIPRFKISNGYYQAAIPEILDVLKAICKIHMLPLAQTWIPRIQQEGGHDSRQSDENFKDCICIVEEACCVNDLSVLDFHKACSEHYLSKGQGVAGAAFTTNQPRFSPDITSYCKTEYPLSHHARMFGLKGAVAIRLRSTCTGTSDFVLEFFLPQNCTEIEEQKHMLNELSMSVQSLSRTLRVVNAIELERESTSLAKELIPSSDALLQKSGFKPNLVQSKENATSAKQHENEILGGITTTRADGGFIFKEHGSRDLGIQVQTENKDTGLPTVSKLEPFDEDLDQDSTNFTYLSCDDSSFPDPEKSIKKRRRKTEKTVSLQVLRNYFAGSLKDAAKSLGVCPTTLKRICRVHGITRWPSRKIKKVDHSLKKLQVVINSVHGADNAINLSSLYKDFSVTSTSHETPSEAIPVRSPNKTNGGNVLGQKQDNNPNHHNSPSSHSSLEYSRKSSPSHSNSSDEKICSKSEEKIPHFPLANGNKEPDLWTEAQTFPDSAKGLKFVTKHSSTGSLSVVDNNTGTLIRIKAMFGSEKVRLRLQHNWEFEDLKREILKRFNIVEPNSVKLKYLDDDEEWVLLNCDADLQECIHIHRLSSAPTIKLLLQPAVFSIPTLISSGS